MKRGHAIWLFALGFLFWGSLAGEVMAKSGDPLERIGPPVSILPEHFSQPLCIFVRSQECPQTAGTAEPACNFQYHYPGPDGLYHPVNGEELFQSLPSGVPVLILIHGSFVDFEEEPELLEAFEWIRGSTRSTTVGDVLPLAKHGGLQNSVGVHRRLRIGAAGGVQRVLSGPAHQPDPRREFGPADRS